MKKLILALFCLFSIAAYTQTTGILDSSRVIDWTGAGAGSIPTRTVICSTLNPGATAASINAAIAACPANEVVFLNAGTYSITAGLLIETSNITVRGAGADKTFLKPSNGQNCNGVAGSMICVWNGDGMYAGGVDNTANWTAGYSKGTNVITLSSHTNLNVGQQLYLDQYNDTYQIASATCSGSPGTVVATIGTHTFSTSNGHPIATIQGSSVSGYNTPTTGGGAAYTVTAVTGTTVSYALTGSCPASFTGTATMTLSDGALTISNDGTFSSYHPQGNNTGRPGNSCGPGGYQCRSSVQIVTVTACGLSTFGSPCSSNSITISPGVYDPHIRADRSPGAWWGNTMPVTGVGIENLSVDGQAVSNNVIAFLNATNSWGKGLRTLSAGSSHVLVIQSNHITYRDSYMYGNQCHGGTCDQSYGSDTYTAATDNLFENNIYQHLAIALQNEGGMGNVYGYNFDIDDDNHVEPDFPLGSLYSHAPGVMYLLSEGNVGQKFFMEDFHGNGAFPTTYRSYWRGWEPGRTTQTTPVTIQTGYTNANVVGNVLGQSGYATHYTWAFLTDSDTDGANCSISIIATGFNGLCNDRGATSNCAINNGDGNTCEYSDLRINLPTASHPGTTMYWGNYDTVNAANRFNGSEVPSTLPIYANPVPSSNTLSTSFYGANYTAFSQTPWGTPVDPPIGPDVTGGNISGVGGHANMIPAQLAFLNNPIDSNYSTTSTVTNATCSGSVATLTIGSNAANIDPGSLIIVSGINPSGYNVAQTTGTQVSATTGTTVSYAVASCPGSFVSGGSAISPAVLLFNAANSYANGGGGGSAPNPPTGVIVIVK